MQSFMRYSDLFGKTRRDAPAEITDPAHRLAFRAGLVRSLSTGESVYLPLGARILARMSAEARRRLRDLGGQELCVSSIPNLFALAAGEIQSYKHLPAVLFWLERGRTRLQIASLQPDRDAAERASRELNAFAASFFEWAQTTYSSAEDIDGSQVWYSTASTGQVQILRCSAGDYAATRSAARPNKPKAKVEALLPAEQVATPHCDTIDSLAQFLGVPTARTAKAVFYYGGEVIFAVVRGDLQIDEEKLKRALGVAKLRFATDDEILLVGASPGYASPVDVHGAKIVTDDSIVDSPNLVAGANREGFHLLNTNVPRDYKPDLVTDIALAREGGTCPNGDGKLELVKGVVLGRSERAMELGASYLDSAGRPQKQFATRLEIDLGQTLLAYAGAHNDGKGIVWSRALAPYAVHVVALNVDKPEVAQALERVTTDLDKAGLDYLLDDRAESAGVKFNDADLIGLPIRLTVGPRTVSQNAAEVKQRDQATARLVPIDGVLSAL